MKTIVIAPHPDDEILGCGGALLRRKAEGAELAWLIVTGMHAESGWSIEQIVQRNHEIEQVTELIGFSHVYNLNLPTAQLDTLPTNELVSKISNIFNEFEPEEVFLPNKSDVHTDHQLVHDAVISCSKWFRYPFIHRILAYETLSETEFGLDNSCVFSPNYFIDISKYLEKKIEVISVYQSELGTFPFPRSIETIRALATVRGAAAGYFSAEAFQLLRERQ